MVKLFLELKNVSKYRILLLLYDVYNINFNVNVFKFVYISLYLFFCVYIILIPPDLNDMRIWDLYHESFSLSYIRHTFVQQNIIKISQNFSWNWKCHWRYNSSILLFFIYLKLMLHEKMKHRNKSVYIQKYNVM